jgi:hypothetical protein
MPIQFDNFDQGKVDRLKNHLAAMASKNKAKFYEIFVDNLKAVPKTDEPNEFDGFEDYLTPDSVQLKIVIYNSGSSPRNDQYVFLLKARDRAEALDLGLNGMPIQTFSFNDISEWREKQRVKSAEQMEIQRLKRENNELRGIVDEREAQIAELTATVKQAQENGNKIGGVHWGSILSFAAEDLLKRNKDSLTKIPLIGETLSGIFSDNNQPKQISSQPVEESEVTFKRKEETSGTQNQPILTEEEKEFVGFFKELRSHFNEDEMGLVIEILELLSQDKTQVPVIVQLLQTGPQGD